MPVLSVGDQSIGQSAAINFYVASECGLLGDSTFEAASIISVSEHLKEMITAYRTVMPWGQEPTPEAIEKWFDSGATDSVGTADRAGQPTRYLKWWAGRIEAALGSNGFAVGNRLSMADVLIYNVFAEQLKPEEVAADTPSWKMEPFYCKAKTDAVLATHPKIAASCAAVASNENVQRWLSIRGVQGF